MQFLKNLPFWVWFILVTILCYVVWNPTGYSVYDLWMGSPMEEQFFLKLFISFILVAILFFFLVTTFQTIGFVGIVLYIAFLAITIGLFYEQGWVKLEDLTEATYWPQPIVALMLTIGLLFNKIRFAITGIRAVDDIDD